jgi:hypothetical protein
LKVIVFGFTGEEDDNYDNINGPFQQFIAWLSASPNYGKREHALRSLCASADHDVWDKARQLKLEEEMKSGIRAMFSDDALTHVGGDNIGWSRSMRLGADDGGCGYTILDVLVIFYLQRRLQKPRARQ